jgi:hypothetical protein
MAYLYGIWACGIVFAVAGLYRLLVVRRIREELHACADLPRDSSNQPDWNLIGVLKVHKQRFPVSRTRSLSNLLNGISLLASAMALTLIIAAQFQPHSLFHLISAAK